MIELRWKPISSAKEEFEVAHGSAVTVLTQGLATLQYRQLQGEEWSEWEDVPIGGEDD